jgi:CheY-like chemotaxis protein
MLIERDRAMPNPHQSQTKSRVLVVDDSPTLVAMIVGILEANGYEARTAGNGEEAFVEMTGKGKPDDTGEVWIPDLVILDLVMPVMDGNQLMDLMLKSAIKSPVILLSGYIDTLRHHKDEFSAILMKPYRHSDLLDKVREALEPQSYGSGS